MASPASATTRLDDYLVEMLPWAHGHQRKAIRDFVRAIIEQQTGCHAQLARRFGQQDAAAKRLSRLLHHARLAPRHWADAVLLHARGQLPAHGPVRLALDWTSAGPPPLLVVSLLGGRRAVPLSGRASEAAVLTGRMKRDALAVMRRAVTRVLRQVGRRRGRVTAARGCAAVAWLTLRTAWRVAVVSRVKKRPTSCRAGVWRQRNTLRCPGNTRRRSLGRRRYGERPPPPLWVTRSRQREAQGQWGRWDVVAKRPDTAEPAMAEEARRPGGAAGCREAQWWRGCAHARSKPITAWSRLFAWWAIALLVVTSLATRLWVRGAPQAGALRRRGASRRRGRCALSLVSAMSSLLQQDESLYGSLTPRLKLKLEGKLANVS
jgi:hypothetical protein